MQEEITGYVEHIIYQNASNGYTVFELAKDGEVTTVTGNLGQISEGESLKCQGYFVVHPTYGEQFSCLSYESVEPEDLVAVERYLGSGAIKGIGPAIASRIIKTFGDDTLRIMDEEPERLAEIRGISESGARDIAVQVSEKRELRSAMIYLQQFGISLALAVKIYDTYGQSVYSILKTNPYKLADDIVGVGFRIADEIATKNGFAFDSDFRINSGIYYVLLQAVADGHTYLPVEILHARASELIGIEIENFEQHILELEIDKKVVRRTLKFDDTIIEAVYASAYFAMEVNVAQKLLDLDITFRANENRVDNILKLISKEADYEQDEEQRRAVISAMTHGVTVITGGPGTGKTTTINAIIKVFEEDELKIVLAAPTGRAAKRITETTKCEAKTIHRLLEVQGISDDDKTTTRFMKNEDDPLDADVVIIDEMSMVDIFLMNALVKAVPIGARLILVGDASQLPSVGPGNVLRDIINSEKFSVVALKKIFRQKDAGDIIINAHKIDAGEEIDTDKRSKDFLFVKRQESGRILGSTVTLVKEKLPKYVNADSFDIQVLTPMRKGPLGVMNLNRILQEALNPPASKKREREFPQGIFREGDKVMQIKNNYDIEWSQKNAKGFTITEGTGIFNGDIGYIKSMNLFAEEMTIIFDENREVIYPFAGASELELAYALTVHKSQGSEYPAVVIPLLSGPVQLMNRNLIYTGVTRAKSCVCIVGSPETFLAMVRNTEVQKRYSSLDYCIKELAKFRSSYGNDE